MAETFNKTQLTNMVQVWLNPEPASLQFSPVQTGKHNASYWVDSDAGRFVLRIAPPDDAGFLFYELKMMRQEPELHTLIRAQTDIPIARIVGYNFNRTHIDRDYLLMEALPGTPISNAHWLTHADLQRALAQVGEHLRELHTLTATEYLGKTTYGYLGEHHPMEPQATWAAAFNIMWNQLLDDVVACGAYSEQEAKIFRDLLDTYLPLFERSVTPCLLHMDVWSQNILVDEDGNVTGLVDFDRALWGDVEIEFAVLDYCGISEPAFWEGYDRPRDTSPEAEIRREFYLLYEVQKYMPIRVWRGNNPQDAQRYKKHSFSLAAELIRKSQ